MTLDIVGFKINVRNAPYHGDKRNGFKYGEQEPWGSLTGILGTQAWDSLLIASQCGRELPPHQPQLPQKALTQSHLHPPLVETHEVGDPADE